MNHALKVNISLRRLQEEPKQVTVMQVSTISQANPNLNITAETQAQQLGCTPLIQRGSIFSGITTELLSQSHCFQCNTGNK